MPIGPALDLLVARDDLARLRPRTRPLAPLDAGAVRFSIDRFALTANNVTYAAFGDAMAYWQFFPSGEDGWGCVPVWGFGTVVESACDGVAVGERHYGYFPMASHLDVRPARVRETGFVDDAAHRRPLNRLYNQYTRVDADPLYDAAREPHQLLYRPLFITSYALDDWLADGHRGDAGAVLVSSASSKTGYGLGWALARRRPGGPEAVALTSARNADFVEALGCFDRVVTYDALESVDATRPVAYVDFAGDRALRARVHRHFSDALRSSVAVGASHVDAIAPPDDRERLPGPKTEFFFAPAQIGKRIDEWGAAPFAERFASAWHAFIARVDDRARPWVRIVEAAGVDATTATWQALVTGRVAPDEGHVATLVA